MMRLYAIPFSTNVERVTLALAHKDLDAEIVMVDPADRSEVRRVSGQDLVPVLLDDGGMAVLDSTAIVEHLERRYPEPALYPAEPARRAEMEIFIDWFNRVWKRPPNAIVAEMGKPRPDRERIERLGAEITGALDRFEGMLHGRDHLMGDDFSAADCLAFPFLRYALLHDPEDDHLFHQVLIQRMPLGDDHPRLTDWIRRVDRRPRARGAG